VLKNDGWWSARRDRGRDQRIMDFTLERRAKVIHSSTCVKHRTVPVLIISSARPKHPLCGIERQPPLQCGATETRHSKDDASTVFSWKRWVANASSCSHPHAHRLALALLWP
jgi:hypothetical protein